MIKRIFHFKVRSDLARAALAVALTFGVMPVTAEVDMVRASVAFERISAQSEQMLAASGLMDATSYSQCSGWSCRADTCGKYCWCAKPHHDSPGVCQG